MTTTTPSILGQSFPDMGVDTTLFTVASGQQVQFSLFVCNQNPDMDYFTIALVKSGGQTNPELPSTYIAYATPLIGNGVFSASGLYLNSGDQVRVMSANGGCSFTATGLLLQN